MSQVDPAVGLRKTDRGLELTEHGHQVIEHDIEVLIDASRCPDCPPATASSWRGCGANCLSRD
ncbi:hypothetical protein [Saccharopolyspora sp. NPDC002376]